MATKRCTMSSLGCQKRVTKGLKLKLWWGNIAVISKICSTKSNLVIVKNGLFKKIRSLKIEMKTSKRTMMTPTRVMNREIIKVIMRIWMGKKSLLSALSADQTLTPKIGCPFLLHAVEILCAISASLTTMLLGSLTLSALTADRLCRVSQTLLSHTMRISC